MRSIFDLNFPAPYFAINDFYENILVHGFKTLSQVQLEIYIILSGKIQIFNRHHLNFNKNQFLKFFWIIFSKIPTNFLFYHRVHFNHYRMTQTCHFCHIFYDLLFSSFSSNFFTSSFASKLEFNHGKIFFFFLTYFVDKIESSLSWFRQFFGFL